MQTIKYREKLSFLSSYRAGPGQHTIPTSQGPVGPLAKLDPPVAGQYARTTAPAFTPPVAPGRGNPRPLSLVPFAYSLLSRDGPTGELQIVYAAHVAASPPLPRGSNGNL